MKKSSLIIILLAVLFSGLVQAEAVLNSKFAKYDEAQLHWWYLGAYTSLGHVASLESEEKGKCVWNWFFLDYKKQEAFLMKTIKKYPDYTPTSVIIALLRKDCGVFQKKIN